VNFVDYRVGQSSFGWAVIVPIELGVDRNAFRNPVSAVLGIHLQIVPRKYIVRENGCLPVDLARDRSGVGIQKKLVVVETMAFFRLPRTLDPVTVELARLDVANEPMPNVCSSLTEGNAFRLFSLVVEKAQVYSRSILRKDRKVGPFTRDGGAQRIRAPRKKCAINVPLDAECELGLRGSRSLIRCPIGPRNTAIDETKVNATVGQQTLFN
jgi:hypothetical protein